MTPEQQNTFIGAARRGVALGLNHRFEWYVNALRMLHHGPYSEIDSQATKIQEAFVAFERGTASCQEEEQEYADMDIAAYAKRVGDWYSQRIGTLAQR